MRNQSAVNSSTPERRVYRCADCGVECYSAAMPAGWELAARQYPGRHTVWAACGCLERGGTQPTADSADDQPPADRVERRIARERRHSVQTAKRLGSWLAVAITCCALLVDASDARALNAARQSAGSAGSSAAAVPVVNVNAASAAELAYLPGVGPKIAAQIIAARPYSSVDDLERAKGIGAGKLAKMRAHVVVSGKTTATAKIKAVKAEAK